VGCRKKYEQLIETGWEMTHLTRGQWVASPDEQRATRQAEVFFSGPSEYGLQQVLGLFDKLKHAGELG